MTRIALVTGGLQGLGAASANALETMGCVVAVTTRSREKAEVFRNETGRAAFAWDVADYGACEAGVAAVEEELGPIDILVNNAGVTSDIMLHKMTPEQWRSVMHTDLDSMFNMCRPVIGGMRQRGFGRIVNIASVNALKGQMGQTNYCAAKAGVLGFTRALALESAAKGVTVNAIAPGYIDTDMVAAVPEDIMRQILKTVPVGRLGTSEEVGRCVSFLASDDANFVTGVTLNVNGGLYMN